MDIYEKIIDGDLAKLSNEEFNNLLESFEDDVKKMPISIEEQKKLREILREESERRIVDKKDFDDLNNELIELNNEILRAQMLLDDKGFEPDFLNRDNIEKYISEKNEEINKLQKTINEKKLQEQVSVKAFNIANKIKYSIVNKKIDNGKKAICKMPQKICSLSINNLKRMYNGARKIYNKMNNNLEEQNTEVRDALEDLFDFKDDFLSSNKVNSAERFIIEQDIVKEAKKYYNKYKKIERKQNILATLKPGIIRTLNLPKKAFKKIMDENKNSMDAPQVAISM